LSAAEERRIKTAGILAAGEGSRLKGMGLPKALVPVAGVPLIEWTLRGLKQAGAQTVACIVNENLREVERFLLTGDFGLQVRVLVQTTQSSLFSLLALREFLEAAPFLLCTTDTILPLHDWAGFGQAASTIRRDGNNKEGLDALLGVTDFVEDENPLWVELDETTEGGLVRAIGPEAERSRESGVKLITSGVYAFHPSIYDEAERIAEKEGARLRHLLARLPEVGKRVGAYCFQKTIDVDRPEDLKAAEAFLQETGAVEGRGA
jgi:NDP-sugar pyrophosphorylase family protein